MTKILFITKASLIAVLPLRAREMGLTLTHNVARGLTVTV